MSIRLSVTNLEISSPEVFSVNTNLTVNFNVVINEPVSGGSPPMPEEEPHHNYGFMVKILGYENPNSRDRTERDLFEFERTVYRWVPSGGNILNGGVFGGRLERVTTNIYNLTSTPIPDIDGYHYSQSVNSPDIEMSILDVNPSRVINLPPPWGTFYSKEVDHIFARVSIVQLETGDIVPGAIATSRVVRGYFGAREQ